MNNQDSKASLGDAASGWLIALSESPDDAGLRAQFEAWRGADPSHAAIWNETVRSYHLFGKVDPSHPEAWRDFAAARGQDRPVLDSLPLRNERRRLSTRTVRRRHLSWLGAAAVAACLLVLLLPAVLLRLNADYVTGTGEMRAIALADGSIIHLGPQSAIGVSLTGTSRQIRLLQGEAFFEVRHDPARPFHVAAKDAVITDIGTAFDVNLRHDDIGVAVAHGEVRVDVTNTRQASTQLGAGDWLRLPQEGVALRGTMPADEVAASTHGEIVADKRPVREVVEALRPYYRGKIVLLSNSLANRTVTGIYDARDPVGVLMALAATQGGSLRRITPWLLILS